MEQIDQALGKTMTVNEVAKYLRVSSVTVRNNYQSLGGVRLGTRYLFFEKNLINAILYKGKKAMDGPSHSSEENIPEGLSDKKGGESLGGKKKTGFEKKPYIKDTHNLLD